MSASTAAETAFGATPRELAPAARHRRALVTALL